MLNFNPLISRACVCAATMARLCSDRYVWAFTARIFISNQHPSTRFFSDNVALSSANPDQTNANMLTAWPLAHNVPNGADRASVLSVYIQQDTVLQAKSDSGAMFCLRSYQGLRIDRSLVY